MANWQSDRAMTPRQYRMALNALGMNIAQGGRYLGVSNRTAHRYITGEASPSAAEALLLRSLQHHREMPLVPKWR